MNRDPDRCEVHQLHEEALLLLRETMPQESELSDLAELFKSFGDFTRIRILAALLRSELCVCDLAEALSMTPSAISHQLKLLRQAKLIESRRDGKSVFYHLADDHVRTILLTGREHIAEKQLAAPCVACASRGTCRK